MQSLYGLTKAGARHILRGGRGVVAGPRGTAGKRAAHAPGLEVTDGGAWDVPEMRQDVALFPVAAQPGLAGPVEGVWGQVTRTGSRRGGACGR
jgi:hypothetical protein